MSKRMKVLVSVLVTSLLVTIGGAAMAIAQEEEPEPPEEELMLPLDADGLLARVAEILDIPGEDLVDAFQQARQEMREEAFYSALDKAVAEGIITEEEADEIREWWEQKPDVLERGLLRRAFRFMGPRDENMSGNRLGVRAKMGPQLWQEMNQQAWQGMGQQPWRGIRQQARQVIGQRAYQGMNGGWQQLGPPWLAD